MAQHVFFGARGGVQSEAIVFLNKELDVEARIELERVLGEMEEIERLFSCQKLSP